MDLEQRQKLYSQCRDLFDQFISSHRLTMQVIPAKWAQGSLIHFERVFYLDERPVHERTLIKYINGWIHSVGYPYKLLDHISGLLEQWAWEEYKRQVSTEEAWALMDRPRYDYRGAPGRPRKDGTNRTIKVLQRVRTVATSDGFKRLADTDPKAPGIDNVPVLSTQPEHVKLTPVSKYGNGAVSKAQHPGEQIMQGQILDIIEDDDGELEE